MYIGIQPEFVVTDTEFCLFCTDAKEAAALSFLAQLDALFKISGINRMCKGDGSHHLLGRRIRWVLIKLYFTDLGGKGRSIKARTVFIQRHMLGNQAALEADVIFNAYRPIVPGRKAQTLIIHPAP